jgi:hypothetical protein
MKFMFGFYIGETIAPIAFREKPKSDYIGGNPAAVRFETPYQLESYLKQEVLGRLNLLISLIRHGPH